jgi:hypothetical protein
VRLSRNAAPRTFGAREPAGIAACRVCRGIPPGCVVGEATTPTICRLELAPRQLALFVGSRKHDARRPGRRARRRRRRGTRTGNDREGGEPSCESAVSHRRWGSAVGSRRRYPIAATATSMPLRGSIEATGCGCTGPVNCGAKNGPSWAPNPAAGRNLSEDPIEDPSGRSTQR